MPRFWSSTVGLPGPTGPAGESVSGDGVGAQTLDQVCDLGNTTDQDLKFQDAYINYDGPDEDSYLYFFEGQTATGASLMWDDDPGTFAFDQPLDMGSHKITSVTNPTNAQDAATKSYVDTVSGVMDLDAVCDIGNITDQIITAAQLRSNADIFVNFDGPDGDGNIYFYHDSDPTYAWMGWDYSEQEFHFSDQLYCASNIVASQHLKSEHSVFINHAGLESSGELFFYTNSDPQGAYLQWNESANRFKLSHPLLIDGALVIDDDEIYINFGGPDGDSYIRWYDSGVGGSYSYLKWDQSDQRHEFSHGLNVIGDLVCNYQYPMRLYVSDTRIWVNFDGGESDCQIFFYEGGSAEGASLRWNDTGGNFHLSHGLTLDAGNLVAAGDVAAYGDLSLNIDYGGVDSIINFSNAGTLKWDFADSRFEFSSDLYVNGQINTVSHVFAGRNIGVNTLASDNDGVIVFYKPSSGAEYFKWNKTTTRFEFTDELSMESNKIVNVTDPTANQDAATKKYVDDNVGLRSGPILIMDAMWLDDDSGAPLTSLLSGTYPALHDGDKISEAAYVFDSPWSIGIDLGVTRDVARIKLFDDPADQDHPADTGSGWGGIYAGGNYDSLKIYTADMNGAWTLRETVHPVPRTADRPCSIDIALSGTYSCRFIKLYCDLGGLAALNGGSIGMAEIEAHYD